MIYGGLFDLDNKLASIKEKENLTQKVDFWQNQENANTIMEELSNLNESVNSFLEFRKTLDDVKVFLELNSKDELLIKEFESNVKYLEKNIMILEQETLFNGKYDSHNIYVEIHSGAGGTESNDWADMVAHMYEKYFEKSGFNYQIIDEQPGEEVGIKGKLLHVKGKNAYGKLKGETGVHRLVRISPFDSAKRRHTSFASVLITPEINKEINVEINEKDLKIDVYHSGGAGGQSVNTTDSAVRITHLPSGIVVTCQNERSQLQNKDKALEILKAKLYLLEESKLNDKLSDLKGKVMDVNFGSQIRSYVLHPYNMVKDHRTNVETSNVKKVLDGDLDIFIEGYLKWKK